MPVRWFGCGEFRQVNQGKRTKKKVAGMVVAKYLLLRVEGKIEPRRG